MFTQLNRILTPRVWFTWILRVLLTLVAVYLILHAFWSFGLSATKLTVEDMTIISDLLYEQETIRPAESPASGSSTTPSLKKDSIIASPKKNSIDSINKKAKLATPTPTSKAESKSATIPSSQRALTDAQRQRVFGYIINTYSMRPDNAKTLKNWIGLFGQPGTLMNALKDRVLLVKSFFWLTGGGLYWEIIFWSWFGLIASLLFNVSEALRTGPNYRLISGEVWTHIAKFFYAPLCSIAIFLGLSLAIADQKVLDQVNFSPNQVLVAFILGFFSGRVVDLLQRIKNVILPDGASATATPALPANSLSTGTLVSALGLTDIETIIRQYGALWQKSYPNVTGIAAQIKTTAGQPTGRASILFEVTQKVSDLSTGSIPSAFTVTMPDGRESTVPTDIEEVGITRFSYQAGKPEIHLSIPTAVGGSIASLTGTGWGTMGLRVKDNTNEYVLTCCHVLCGHLIDKPNWKYNQAEHGVLTVIVPRTDETHLPIGEVSMASFNSKEDFALVRLTNAAAVASKPFGQDITFTGYQTQLGASISNEIVNMVGAFSNYQFADIVAVYQQGEYQDIPNLDPPARMQGLVKTNLLSSKGDSGAAVFISDGNKATVIGLLIADNATASYILPVSDYLRTHGLRISP